MEARVEALMENLTVAVMQANALAAESRDYVVLAETLAYALDLAELGLSGEPNAWASCDHRKPTDQTPTRVPQPNGLRGYRASILDHAAVSVLRCNGLPQPKQLVTLCP